MTGLSNSAKALSFAFDQIFGTQPQSNKAFFLRAEPLEGAARLWQRGILNVQSCKPIHDRLQEDGCRVAAELTGSDYDLGLLLITKHKQENLANLARCWMALRPGGLLICVGGNDLGVSSIEKALKSLIRQPASLSKHHCKVLWGQRGEHIPEPLTQWAEAGCLQSVPSLGCWSQPGIYNWNKIDAGSALLVQALPGDLRGRAADLGAGWGYLSQQLLQRSPKIITLDLFEAEELALSAAKINLEPFAAAAHVRFHWHDIAQGLPPSAFDLVVMNPPFHDGKATDIALGRAFITAAAQSLVPGGRLFMVTNRQLPYEETLKSAFKTQTLLQESAVYKVISAVR